MSNHKEKQSSLSRLIVATIVMIGALVVGLYLPSNGLALGSVAGLTLSFPALWFFVVLLIWWVFLSRFIRQDLQKTSWYEKYYKAVDIGSWLLPLGLVWIAFIGILDVYIEGHFAGLL